MIRAENISKSYGPQILFDEVSFLIGTGERVGLVGRNGHGKSTLFKMLLGHEEPDSGEITIPRHYSIGHLSQHISFTQDSVLKEGCLSLPPSEDGIDETYKVETILAGLGIPEEYFHIDPWKLSGGYQIRLNLAKVLVSDPNLLLLDEPTNYLDIVSVRWLKRFLQNWRKELVIITHDRDFMDSVTTHTMAIHRCNIRKVSGSTEKLYSQILLDEEVFERTRLNDEKKRLEAERFINRFRASATKASAVQSRIKALDKVEKLEKLDDIKSLDFEFNCAPFTGKTLFEAQGLTFGYSPDGPPLIDGLGFAVGKKDRIGIIGKNGKGKTTLLNMLAGEIHPTRGDLKCHPNMKLAYFGQTNIQRLNTAKTVEQELMDAHPEHNRGQARRICGAMMFEKDNALKKIEVLSGGEKSRVLLGKLLLTPANLLLLDEPTNHLDMESIDSLVEAIGAFSGAVMIVTHSELILNAVANRLIVFDGGKVTFFEGTYAEFLAKVGWEGENDDAAGKKAAKPKEAKGVNRKELRRLRADILNEKSRVIGPLQKKIKSTEEEIIEREKTAEALSAELARISENGNPAEIAALSRSYHEAKTRVDVLFNDLDSLTKEIETKSREYEERLGAL